MLRRLLFLFVLLSLPGFVQARGIEPELVAEGAAPPGGQVDLAIHMRPAPGWHGYWLNPGDAGLPMQVQWQLPAGFSAGPLRYPVPSRLEIAGLMNYVYERDYAVLVRLNVPRNAAGNVQIRAAARWLACTDKICVPEQGELSLDVPVGAGTPNRAQFDQWRRALAQPLASVGHFKMVGDKLQVAIPIPASVGVKHPYLFPITDGPVDYEAKQSFRRVGDTLVAELQSKGPVPHGAFAGMLAFGDENGLEFNAVPGSVPSGGSEIGGLGAKAILWAVLGAILGGILLNLMPCVFPILALKALHLARAGGDFTEARRDAMAYTAGAIVGTGALGIALLLIRAGGDAAGWAFQLQDPRTIMLLLLLATVITANLLGVFELPVLGESARPAGGFSTGALAAFVATPCAGPFLGAALGTALLLPPAGSVLVFAALGFGLALPFLLVALLPGLQKRLPKPGPWMDRLKRFLAIPMAATAVACLWLLQRLSGTQALVIGVAAVALLLVVAFLAGAKQRRGMGGLAVLTGGALAIAIVALAVPFGSSNSIEARAGAEPWSDLKVANYVAAHQPVFVYFTADWCLSCKVNEAAAIDRGEVRDAFKKAGVKVLVGDWTKSDPAITRFLEDRGRAGVPFYLWYAPGKEPEELPQILTPGMLISRAREAKH